MLLPRADPDHTGVTGALSYNPTEYCILAACTAIAWAFAIELNITVLLTFHRRNGIYFWSLLISSWGFALHALGFILKFLVGASWLLDLVFVNLGWVMMVSGQSFVLYSRLNLVVRNKNLLRSVLALIIIDGLCLHIPIIVFIYGANSPQPRWVDSFNIMERVQLLGFSLQESVIGAIYIVATTRLLGAVYYMRTRKAMVQLLIVNAVCISMDIVLITLEFSGHYVAEASVKPLIYAIKLKLEFAVYSQLVGFTRATFEDRQEIETASHTEPHHDYSVPQYHSPSDFFKNIPKVLKKPTAPSHPTVHTHPEELLKTQKINLDRFDREWDSSKLELSPSTLAAALTASGGRAGSPRPTKKARSLLGTSFRMNSGSRTVNRSRNRDGDRRSETSIPSSGTRIATPKNHEP